jgi:hypothetical protein
MKPDEVQFALRTGPDEPAVGSSEIQGELQGISKALLDADIKASHRMFFRDAADGGASYIGEFLVPIAQVAIPALGVVLGGWLQGRFGRKVRIKVGDVEAEARALEEVETLLQRVQEFKASVERKDETQP